MNRLVVRTLSKNRLCILLHLPYQTKRFDRSSNETVEAFVNRIKSKLPTEVKTVALTDCRGTTVKKTVELCDALIPTNQFVCNDIVYEILVDPPTIESLKIPNTPVAGLAISPTVKLIDLTLNDLTYTWETKAKDSDSWEQISTSEVLLLYQKLVGNVIRLSSKAVGVETVFSNVIGPVIDDKDTNILLSRAVPIEYGYTRLMSYNILADVFMESKTKPITNHFPYCSKKYQAREYREPRIVAEVWAHNPHLLCLQEVEDKTFSKYLVPMLQSYQGHITVKKGRFKAGCAIFFKLDQYEECQYESFPLPDLYQENSQMLDLIDLGNQMNSKFPETWRDISIRSIMSQIVVLKNKESKKLVIVGNTHLYWNPKYHIIALFHIHALCSKIQAVRKVYQKQGEGVSLVICGDMNSQTTSLVHAYLTDGVVSQVENGDELQNFLHKNVRNPLKLTLARGEPNYTNYTADFKDVIDYIVCDENSTVGHVTPSPNLSDLEESEGCPSAIFPSDHLPIISDILLADTV
ncbi:2',5'-phosphodiesterase 12-like [Bolinopsis microptera]|uniref:2',5'-phosphodiesterase 12-like n=1 Tax=Bolinopsis microptera TaxID=2820187 RepID=UPI0030791549